MLGVVVVELLWCGVGVGVGVGVVWCGVCVVCVGVVGEGGGGERKGDGREGGWHDRHVWDLFTPIKSPTQ